MEWLEQSAGWSEENRIYLEHGSECPTKTLTAEQKSLVEECVMSQEDGQCYYNCWQACAIGQHHDRIGYQEGPVCNHGQDDLYKVINHAWLTVDGVVADITWDHNPKNFYWGVSYDPSLVMDVAEEHEEVNPLASYGIEP
jgi:hypothetical protein